MADTSLRETETDRAWVHMFSASAFKLLCGAPLGHGQGSTCPPILLSSLQRPSWEPTPVGSFLKGQFLLSLLLPRLWKLPESCPQASWCQRLPSTLLLSSPLAMLLAYQPSQSQKQICSLSLIQLLTPQTIPR